MTKCDFNKGIFFDLHKILLNDIFEGAEYARMLETNVTCLILRV